LLLLGLCFAASGLAALVYQTARTRQFALVFGTSELAVATVLAAYMGGLAAGAWLVERYLQRIHRPVMAYASLEFGIGASAVILVPLLIWSSSSLLTLLFGDQPSPPSSEKLGTSAFYLIGAFVALAVPTTLMGATLPLLARHAVHVEGQIGRRIGLLYAANTAGAVVGALITAFWLLPGVGLRATIWVGAAVNLLVFVLAAALARRAHPEKIAAPSRAIPRARFTVPPAAIWVLPLMLASGAVSFLHEVLWSRLLSHIIGSSIYAFGVMVASFLAGISLGGAAGAWLARERQRSIVALALCQLGIAAAAATAYLALDRVIPAVAGLLQNAFMGVLLLLPMTVFIGATYPFAVRILATSAADAGPASARVYAWNTVGAIVGALAGGFVIIPAWRYEGAAQFASYASAALAIVAVWCLAPQRRVIAGAISAAALAGALAFRPEVPRNLLVTSPLNVARNGTMLFYDVGRSASVVLLEQDGMLALRTNGLPEALMDMPGSTPRFSGEYWLSPLAVIARPRTASMLVVGFGGGVVIEGIPPTVRDIDVIELEPVVIEANRATAAVRKRDPLTDTRLNVITNDARGALRLTNKRYDAIVSQPSHPWTAGASHLYTREFMSLARDRLSPGGVFVQWMNVAFLDESLLRSLTATLIEVFGEARIYRPDPNTLVFLASGAPLAPEREMLRTDSPQSRAPGHYARFGINAAEDVVTALVADAGGARSLARGAATLTDDDNRMATSSVFEMGRGLSADRAGRALAGVDPLQRADSFVYRELREALSFHYIMQRTLTFTGLDASLRDRAVQIARLLGESADGRVARAILLRSAGRREDAEQLLRESLAQYPGDAGVRFFFVQPRIGAIIRDTATPEIVEAARGLPAVPRAIVEAGRAALRSDWAAVAALDDQLSGAAWTDPWALDALQVRADWRTRVTTPGARRALGDEAIALLDRAIVQSPTAALYGLRARSAMAEERPEVLVEAVWNYSVAMSGSAERMPATERAEARRGLQSLVKVLDDVKPQSPSRDARRLEVRAHVLAAAERLT